MKVGVLGLKGRMGQIVEKELRSLKWECVELSFDKEILAAQQNNLSGIIEFSSPEALKDLLDEIRVPCVLASTGLSEETRKKILEKSKVVPLFYSSNYSIGLNKLLYLLKNSDLKFTDAEIFETHHIHKKDAPSGTALLLKNELNIEKPIVSFREGEVFGEHEIHHHMLGETLIFKHVAKERNIFAKGAIEALNFLLNKKQGLYSMKDLLLVNGDPHKS